MFKALIISAMLVMGNAAMAESSTPAKEAPAAGETQVLEIKDMDCGGCVSKVKKSLSKVEGLKFVTANPKEKTVEIQITDASKADVNKAIAAIKEGTGWVATVKTK